MKITCQLVVSSTQQVRVTKGPGHLKADEIAIGLTLDIPDRLFTRPVLAATIAIPDDWLVDPGIEAVVDLSAPGIARALRINVDNVRDGLLEAVHWEQDAAEREGESEETTP